MRPPAWQQVSKRQGVLVANTERGTSSTATPSSSAAAVDIEQVRSATATALTRAGASKADVTACMAVLPDLSGPPVLCPVPATLMAAFAAFFVWAAAALRIRVHSTVFAMVGTAAAAAGGGQHGFLLRLTKSTS